MNLSLKDIFLIFIIAIFVYLVYIIVILLKADKVGNKRIVCFTGTIGAGKTYSAVELAYKKYRKAINSWRFNKIFFFSKATKPQLISNVAVKLSKKENSIKLLPSHLLGYQEIPEGSVVLISEFGDLLNQWDFDNMVARLKIEPFVRFFRHWVDGYLIVEDQTSGNIVKFLRDRITTIYSLDRMQKKFFGKVYKIPFVELRVSEDIQNEVNVAEKLERYFAGFFPFKKRYESRAYKLTYKPFLPLSDIQHNSFFVDSYINFSSARSWARGLSKIDFENKTREALKNNDFIINI